MIFLDQLTDFSSLIIRFARLLCFLIFLYAANKKPHFAWGEAGFFMFICFQKSSTFDASEHKKTTL